MTSVDPLIAAHDVVKGYRTAAGYVPVLAGVHLTVAPREMVAIVGASGVGKSTLLHVLGSLDRPESGRVVVAGAVLVCFLATLHPARGAAKLDPAEALRYE